MVAFADTGSGLRRSLRAGAFVAIACWPAIALAAEAGAAPDPATLADACTSCHGLGGRSSGAIPTIAGLDRQALLSQLQAFRDQKVEAVVMNRIARAYTEAEINALADYFSKADKK